MLRQPMLASAIAVATGIGDSVIAIGIGHSEDHTSARTLVTYGQSHMLAPIEQAEAVKKQLDVLHEPSDGSTPRQQALADSNCSQLAKASAKEARQQLQPIGQSICKGSQSICKRSQSICKGDEPQQRTPAGSLQKHQW